MNKNTKITLITLALLAVFGIGGAFAVDNVCPKNLENKLIQMKLQDLNRPEAERIMSQEALDRNESDWWQKCQRTLLMTKAEKASILEQKKMGHEAHLREMAQQAMVASSTATTVPPSELGIIPPIDATVLGRGHILPTNSWRGYVGKKIISVTGTGLSSNPMQGEIFIMIDGHVVGSEFYPTPTATGPVKIVAEKNSVLTLESLAGSFEEQEVGTGIVIETVTTPGGATYYFDMKTRTFR